jgi:hypothetical protein
MPRLVIVSNRVPPPREWTQLAGGLAVRLKGAIAGRNTLWFGWSGTIADQSSAEPTVTKVGKVTFATLDLAETHYMSGEARTTSQPRQSPPKVVPQNQTGTTNGVTNTPGGTASSSVPPGTTSSTGVGASPSGSGASSR